MNRFDLTKLEIDILRLSAEGRSKPWIEAHLAISRATLYRMMEAIRHKLHATNNTHAVAIAIEQGLLETRRGPAQASKNFSTKPDSAPAPPWHTLTEREQEIFMLLGDVKTSQETDRQLARHLKIAEGTVKKHLHSIYQKLGVPNRSSAALLAAQAKNYVEK